jgi:hypothetical protein
MSKRKLGKLTSIILAVISANVALACGGNWVDFARFCVINWKFVDHDQNGIKPVQNPYNSLDLVTRNYWRDYCLRNNNWDNWIKYYGNELPTRYYLCGDCDDFAVMLASIIQKHYGIDTCVAIHEKSNNPNIKRGHAICLVKVPFSNYGYDHVTEDGQHWTAIDVIENTGGIYTYSPYYWNTRADTYEADQLVCTRI